MQRRKSICLVKKVLFIIIYHGSSVCGSCGTVSGKNL